MLLLRDNGCKCFPHHRNGELVGLSSGRGRWEEKMSSHPNANLPCKSPWRLRHMLGLLALKFKQSGISFPETFVFSWERTLFCVLSTQHWIYAQHLSLSTYTLFIYIKRMTEKEKVNQRKTKIPNKPRNTIKETVASAAPGGKHSKRASLEAKDQLNRQKFFALRLWAAKFPTRALSLISGQLQHKKKACKLIKPYFMLLLENTLGKLLFCKVCQGKREKERHLFTCAFYFTALQRGPKWTGGKGVDAHPKCILTPVELLDIHSFTPAENQGLGFSLYGQHWILISISCSPGIKGEREGERVRQHKIQINKRRESSGVNWCC